MRMRVRSGRNWTGWVGWLRWLSLLLGGYILHQQKIFATHLMGGEITYVWMGGNTYLVTLNVYRDCAGISLPNSFPIRVQSPSCGISFTVNASMISSQEVSQICPSFLPQTRCNGGNLPGVERRTYQAVVNLPAQCPDWYFWTSSCCRNFAITNLQNPGGQGFFIWSLLNNATVAGNNSVVFSGSFMPYVCANTSVSYNLGPSDPDNDSIRVLLADALTTPFPGTPIPFVPGLNADSPIRSSTAIVLDTFTGTLCFTPYPNQFAVVGFDVYEYRNNILVGIVHREVQIVVFNCTGQNPNPPRFTGQAVLPGVCGAISGCIDTVTGGVLVTCQRIVACPGTPLTFSVEVQDPDSTIGQQVYLASNATVVLPGSTFDTTYVGGNPGHVRGTVSWTPSTPGTYTVLFTASDSACPIPLEASYAVSIVVVEDTPVYVKPYPNVMLPDSSAYLWVEGCIDSFSLIFWMDSVYPNDTIIKDVRIRGTFSQADFGSPLDTAFTVVFYPGEQWKVLPVDLLNDYVSEPIETLVVTIYGRCGASQEITILLLDSPYLKFTPGDTILCQPDSLWLEMDFFVIDVHHVGIYNPSAGWEWLCIEGSGIFSPWDTCVQPFSYYFEDSLYWVIMGGESYNCRILDTFEIRVSPSRLAFPADTIVCLHDSAWIPFPPSQGNWTSWTWYQDGIPVCQDCPYIGFPVVTSSEIWLEATDAYGCVRRDTFRVFVDSSAWVSLFAEDTILLVGTSTRLIGATPASVFWWSPVDGLLDTLTLVPEVAPDTTTTYYLCIQSDLAGCLRCASVTVHVLKPETCDSVSVFVPVAFTPDGDGVNDVFTVHSIVPLEVMRLAVYDRWGALIYEARDFTVDLYRQRGTEGWDGTLPGGGLARPDVYVWVLEARCPLPPYNEVFLKGDVTLLR